MSKFKLSSKWIAFIIIVVIIVIILMNIVKKNNIKNEIIEGYSEIIDVVSDEYFSGTGTDKWGNTRRNDYATKIGLDEINYEIIEITTDTEKGLYSDNTYVLNIEIKLVCDKNISDDDKYGLADEVFWTFYDIQDDSSFEIGEYDCSYYSTKDLEYSYEDMITIFVNDEKVIYPEPHEPDNYDISKYKDTVKCEICGNRYNKGTDNASSIVRTNMCSSCYKNFKGTKDYIDAIDELPVD